MKDEKKIFKNSNSFRIIVDFSLETFYFVILKKQRFFWEGQIHFPAVNLTKLQGRNYTFVF